MECELRVPEEHRGIGGDSDSGVLPIVYKDYVPEEHFKALVPLAWEYWLVVNQEDYSEWEDLELAPGIVAPYQKVETFIVGNRYKGSEFKLAFVGDRAAGMMLYNLLWGSILVVHAMYVQPEFQLMGLGSGLVNSMGDIKKVLYRTRKANPPATFLGVMKHAKIIAEDSKHFVREMDWQALKAPSKEGAN